MLFAGLLVAVAAEVAVFWLVAAQIGFLWALALLVVVSALGPFVVKRAGFGVLAHTRERLERGEVPTKELFDGLVVLAGGVLICVPGFIGDALGLLLMVGPVRRFVTGLAGHRFAQRLQRTGSGRWAVVNAHARPRGGDLPHPGGPGDGPTGPDGAAGS